jgi:hypothetical protein
MTKPDAVLLIGTTDPKVYQRIGVCRQRFIATNERVEDKRCGTYPVLVSYYYFSISIGLPNFQSHSNAILAWAKNHLGSV